MAKVWLILFVCLAGCGLPNACTDAAYRAQIMPIVGNWDAATAVAQRLPLVELPAQIEQLQLIQHHAGQLVVPACAQDLQQALLRSMNERIEGYLLVLDQSPDAALRMHMIAADTAMTQFRERMNAPVR